MASVASQLIEEVTAHAQRDSLEDAREICLPNNLRILDLCIKFLRNYDLELNVSLHCTGGLQLLDYTGCVNESGEFATLFFFLVRQHWGRRRYRHFAANFKAF